eukprot:COSAG01_NODE_2050_length_8556_cov_63.294312_4_plen_61_part_00
MRCPVDIEPGGGGRVCSDSDILARYDLDKIRLEELPEKARQADLEQLRLAQEQALADMKQ